MIQSYGWNLQRLQHSRNNISTNSLCVELVAQNSTASTYVASSVDSFDKNFLLLSPEVYHSDRQDLSTARFRRAGQLVTADTRMHRERKSARHSVGSLSWPVPILKYNTFF